MAEALSERDTHSFTNLIQLLWKRHSNSGRLLGKEDSGSLWKIHVFSKTCDVRLWPWLKIEAEPNQEWVSVAHLALPVTPVNNGSWTS